MVFFLKKKLLLEFRLRQTNLIYEYPYDRNVWVHGNKEGYSLPVLKVSRFDSFVGGRKR